MSTIVLTQTLMQRLWLRLLLLVLLGYALMGKGFAYLFVGEAVLVLGCLVFLFSRRVTLILSDPLLLLWAMFAFWGLYRTVPYIPRYHFDALRDAVIWGYGAFALLIVAFVNDSSQISNGLDAYRKFLRWYLLIVLFIVLASLTLRDRIPKIPWSDGTNIVFLKAADAGVLLAGAALFLILFPKRRFVPKSDRISIYNVVAFGGFVLTAAIVSMTSRGGFLALIVPIILVSFVKAKSAGWKIAGLSIVAVVVGLLAIEANPFTIRIKHRTYTPSDIGALIGSIASSSDSAPGHKGTKEWRLAWWRKIIHYTFGGPYFWKGKGFGVNLAVQDHPSGMSNEENKLRSPHNGNMTILARMGVPGFLIWAALNLVFVFRLVNSYRLALRNGSRFWSSLNLWILSFFLSAFIDMSFDVYLEGPQGGILFWSIIGFGTAVCRVQRYEMRQISHIPRAADVEVLDTEYSLVRS
jgi:hypothetical protein